MPNVPNYSREMDAVLRGLDGQRPRLLLHACCGPCSSAVLEQLSQYFEITILYYNPNIWPAEEYHRREEELERHMEECARHVMGSLEEERSFHELQSPDWANWLDATDYARLQEFCGILRRECDYHKGMDFEHRAECLKDTIQRIDQLNAAIRETPTRLSFDVYVHALEDIRSQLIEQQANMYEMLPPMLTWELSTPPHYDSSGEVLPSQRSSQPSLDGTLARDSARTI